MADALLKPSVSSDDRYRVLLVDDSAVARGFIRKFVDQSDAARVVATANNGEHALSALDKNDVDIVILDLEMPVMDGLTALPLILEKKPSVQVIVTSALSLRNAEIGLAALEKGAADFLAKPETSANMVGEYARQLIDKITHLGEARHKLKKAPRQTSTTRKSAAPPPSVAAHSLSLREMPTEAPEAIAIGSSTGGPNALRELLPQLSPKIHQPIFITQHMPAKFTQLLADSLDALSGRPTQEATDGMPVRSGNAYVAPGGFHLCIRHSNAGPVLQTVDTPPENFCKPAVDPMLRSLIDVYGRRLFVIILTGMGSDGLIGGRQVVENGGALIAQDQDSSVVWGMPGAVAEAGLCSFVGPLDELAVTINRIALGSR